MKYMIINNYKVTFINYINGFSFILLYGNEATGDKNKKGRNLYLRLEFSPPTDKSGTVSTITMLSD